MNNKSMMMVGMSVVATITVLMIVNNVRAFKPVKKAIEG